jgi:hypothetical protein
MNFYKKHYFKSLRTKMKSLQLVYLLDWKSDSAEKGLGLECCGGALETGGATGVGNIGGGKG